MQAPQTFHTDRLSASQFQPNDFAELCQLHQDPRVMRTLGGVRTDAETRQFLQEKMAHWDEHGFGYWMFRDKDVGHFVGRGGLQHIDIEGVAEVEVGYTVQVDNWGQGFATEIARALITIGFTQLGLNNIVCFTLTTNCASQRVMEKVGFTFERDFVHAGEPHVLYRLGAN